MEDPEPLVGRVIGTEDATPLEFWVGVGPDAFLQLDDVVALERTDLPGREPVKIYGVVQDVSAREDSRTQLERQRLSLLAEHRVAAQLQEIILPRTKKPAVIFSGSHDLALEEIAGHLHRHLTLLSLPVGSLDGLVNLRQALCQFSGVKKIVALPDPHVRVVNRNAGSGTRLWLDSELHRLNIPAEAIRGYDTIVKTHTEAAALVGAAKADAALGLQAAAHRQGLDFIPLFEERYDLVLPCVNEKILLPLLEYLQTAAFRSELSGLAGYNPAHSGEQIHI